MKFVAFQLAIAKESGKDEALKLESAFDEKECIEGNRPFLFEGMNTIKNVSVFVNTSAEAAAVAGSEQAREQATPSNPTIHFYNTA